MSLKIENLKTTPSLGFKRQLIVTGTYANGESRVVTHLAGFSTSNASVASVSAAGMLYSVAFGTATVEATVDNVSVAANIEICMRDGKFQCQTQGLSNIVESFAGLASTSTPTGQDGTGSNARFGSPDGVTTDGANLYICDSTYQVIRKVVISTREVTTIAGTLGVAGNVDAIGSSAKFHGPTSIATDGENLYISDFYGHVIRRLELATNTVTTLAGSYAVSGSVDAIGAAARFANPHGLTLHGDSLYIADYSNHTIRRLVLSTNQVSTIAGLAGSSGSTNGVGSAARFLTPSGITSNGTTTLYVGDAGNHQVRAINVSNSTVSLYAGSTAGFTDAALASAQFNSPLGVFHDGTNLYAIDRLNNRLRKIDGVNVTTAAGNGTGASVDGTGTSAQLNEPMDVTADKTSLYVVERTGKIIRRIK